MTTLITPTSEWLSRLVKIPSVNPGHAGPRAGTPGEYAIAQALADWFRAFGGEVVFDDFAPNRPNVYGIWRNPSSETWLAIDCHTDTVGVDNMSRDPFDGEIAGDRVWGRGVVDDKASLGVTLAVLEAMHARGQRPRANLIVAAVADEEMSLGGARVFGGWLRARGMQIDELLVAEPTLCAPCYGHKGVARYVFDVHGVSAHTSQPHLGKNAISGAIQLAQAFEREHARLQTLPPSPVGNPTLTVAKISGGRAMNVVPDLASVAIDRRVVHGERAADVAEWLEGFARDNCPLPVVAHRLICGDGFFQSPDSPLVRQFEALVGTKAVTVPYGSDASTYSPDVAKNLLVLGPGSIDQAHTADEWVAVSELDKLAKIYAGWLGLGD